MSATMTPVAEERLAPTRPHPLPPAGTSDTSRWRLPARLARREVRRRPWRTALVMLLIGVPVAGLVLGDIAYRTARLADDPAHDFGTATSAGWMYGDPARVDLPALVERVAPELVAEGQVVVWQEATLPLRSVARPDDVAWTMVRTLDPTRSLTTGVVRLTSGQLPQAADEVVLDATASDALHAGLGDELALVRPAQTFRVVGIAEGDGGVIVSPGFDVGAVQPGVLATRLLLDDEGTRLFSSTVLPGTAGVSLVSPTTDRRADPVALLFGWLAGVMLMAVLGVVVAAAFAVSGRRQLVCIGQLSASGADPAVVRRFLALQGTVAGGLAAVAGAAVGVGAAFAFGDVVAHDGRLAIDVRDIVVVVITAVVVATIAALVPARALIRSSVLSALGGRRPVAPVRRAQVPLGVALLSAGSVGVWLAVAAVSHGSTADVPAMVLATGSGLATLAGVCCVCPVVIDLVARVGSRGRGSVRLAARSLGRHRARSAALLAAVVAITAAGVGAGAIADRELAAQQAYPGQFNGERTVEVTSWLAVPATAVATARPVAADTRAAIERIVGPVRWVESRTALPSWLDPSEAATVPVVADPDVLAAIGLDAAERAEVARHDAVLIDPYGDDVTVGQSWGEVLPGIDVTVLHPADTDLMQRLVVSPEAAADHRLEFGVGSTFAVLDHDLTRSAYDRLLRLSIASSDATYFTGVADELSTVGFLMATPTRDWTLAARLAIVAAIVLLVLAVVAIGMALWAAEGRDERDALVALGAPPRVLARTAALRAWFLATVGAVLGVPFGWWFVRVATSAADAPVVPPWFVIVGVVAVVPVAVTLATWIASAIGQRVRRTAATPPSE
jgi:putative ABC transport system permease protein